MANEYLRRIPTSTGNRRVGTISAWYKINNPSSGGHTIFSSGYNTGSTNRDQIDLTITGGPYYWQFEQYGYPTAGGSLTNYYSRNQSYFLRDYSSWSHILVAFDTTQITAQDRAKIFINGVRIDNSTSSNSYAQNYQFPIGALTNGLGIKIGNGVGALQYGSSYYPGELCDYFYIDGQALTPDVFGFYKVGKGYISAGSAQATDFRPGQWVPKTPRAIKTAINNNGGFGVNGFYLPMNDSRNFGADFHGEPNSIITLNEKLPQPRVGVATTATAGIGYTDALRADPYAANLVLALPFVSGGLQSGFGDYSAVIKGSGSAKTLVWNSGSVTPSIGNTGVYYGSGGNFPGGTVGVSTSADFKMDGSFTVESWFFSNSFNSGSGNHIVQYRNGLAGSDNWVLSQGATGSIRFLLRNDNGTNAADLEITSTGITTNQWYHFAGVYNDTNKTSTVYLNGVTIGISTNISWTRNNGTTLLIGSNSNGPTGGSGDRNINGYIQDLRIYKGVAKYTGGFDVPRPYTPVGIATWRAVPDTTVNNFATMNPLIEARPFAGTNSPSSSTIVTFAGGNLDLTNSASAGNAQRMVSFATIGISTGKWYYEEIPSSNSRVGLSKGFQQLNYTGTLGSGSGLESNVTYGASGGISVANTSFYSTATTLTPPSYNNTNIIGVSIDASLGENNLTVRFYKDGVGVSTLTGVGATSPVREWFPTKTMESSGSGDQRYFNFGQNPTFSGNTTAGTFTDSNGKGLFKYQPPSGFLALCEDNLPTPAIANPGRHFRTVLYTGDGNSGRSIVGVGFTSDLVWIKCRNTARVHGLWDSVRGASNYLVSSSTAVETSDTTNGLQSFNSDGFSIGSVGTFNTSTDTYVAWCWRAGAGTTSTNTDGTIPSVVSVNQDAGFSIVSYTGNATSGATVGHGLGKTPKFFIIRNRNGSDGNWDVYHSGYFVQGSKNYIRLQSTGAAAYASDMFPSAPTSSSIVLGSSASNNQSAYSHIAYCWAEIEGFSKFGSYVGNGNADGPFVYCGFKPAFVILKIVTGTTENWSMFDSSRDPVNNDANLILYPNLTNADSGDSMGVDKLSNGFKIRNATSARYNQSGYTYIFAAWAETPFQTANSK